MGLAIKDGGGVGGHQRYLEIGPGKHATKLKKEGGWRLGLD
jgi:hypothetical protein